MHRLADTGDMSKDSEGISDSPTKTYGTGSIEWSAELDRGIKDVFRIARARLKDMGVA